MTGPNLETRAEYRFLRAIGADVVGMSTVPEVLVAVHAGLKVLGFSIVTDMCLPDALEPASIEEISPSPGRPRASSARSSMRVLEAPRMTLRTSRPHPSDRRDVCNSSSSEPD